MNERRYQVAVQVLTYNQKDYIAQCLDSIVNQRTNFPFVAVVNDDASTDGTTDIVRSYAERYPNIIHPIYQTENQYSKGNSPAKIAADEVNCLNPKYKCILDGDDYWTDMYSLQERYDYLESHPNCAVVYSRSLRLLIPSGEITELDAAYKWEVPTLESLLMFNNVPVDTAMFRLDVYREYLAEVKPFEKKWIINDWAIWLYMITKYELAFINKPTAVYRITTVSVSRKKSLWQQIKYINNIKQLPLFFCQYSKVPGIRKKVERHYNKLIREMIIGEIKKTIKRVLSLSLK